MTLPFISCICITFCRVQHLEEALACFLNQDYQGERELIIYNSCVEQQLVFNHPLVKVINAESRPLTLGETRNRAIEHASGELMVTWDDDNLFLPWFCSSFIRDGFDAEKQGWVRLDKQIYVEGISCKGITGGSADLFAFTKQAWKDVSGYSHRGSGEDREFLGRVSSKFDGHTVELQNHEIGYLYCWNQGASVHHASGGGDDRPGFPSLFERSGKWASERLGAGQEPRGTIILKPNLKQDYAKMAAQFTGSVKKLESRKRGKVAICVLGHAGDCMNVLPIAKRVFDVTGVRPQFYTSRLYGSVLDSVSYIEPIILDLSDQEINKAIEIAKQRNEIVLPLQIHGENYPVERLTESYAIEAWRLAGMLDHFLDLDNFPLILDRRDSAREQRLADSLPMVGKPVMLVNVTGGLSSPWNDGSKMLGWCLNTFQRDYTVIDLAQVRAERIYDVLGLLDRAAVLITSDTYTVHLATASDVPVIAILNDNTQPFGRPWLRTKPRYETLLSLNYSDAMNRVGEIRDAIGTL